MAKLVTQLVAKKYATALFDIAIQEDKMAEYEQEVQFITKAIEDAPDFVKVIQNQKIALDEKISFVENIFSEKVSASIVGLMVIAIKKGRGDVLTQIFEAFLKIVKNKKGIFKATVTSATPLKPSQIEQIKSNLEKETKSQIELDTIIDESIIAGLVIRVGDKVVDASVKGKMQALKKQLTELKLA